jgi:hypothetical protein
MPEDIGLFITRDILWTGIENDRDGCREGDNPKPQKEENGQPIDNSRHAHNLVSPLTNN